MLKYLLVVAGLALMAVGGHGLYQSTLNPPAQGAPDVLIFSLALGAGLTIIVASLWLLRPPPPPPVEPSDEDRAEVIERLQRHTDALRAETQERERPPALAVARLGSGRAEARAVSLPAIMLLQVGPDAGLEQIEVAPPLGTRAEVLARLRDVLPDVELGADGRGTHTGPDHSVTFDAGPDDVVHTLVVDAAGQTGVSLVRWLMEGTGWRGFVPKHGSFVDPEQLDELVGR